MSNSIVRVRENPGQDSLILVIGENGVITPDKETVQEYLKSRNETELKIMKVNKSDGQMVDVTIDHMTYVATQKEEIMYKKSKEELDQIAKCLINIRLDHDYTSSIHSPHPSVLPEIDELDHTLSLLEATPVLESMPPQLVPIKTDPPPLQQLSSKTSTPSNISKRIVNPSQIIPPLTPMTSNKDKVIKLLPVVAIPKLVPMQPIEPPKIIDAPKPVPAKTITVRKPPPKRGRQKSTPPKKETVPDEDAEPEETGEEQEAYSDDDFTAEFEDDSNDSDFAIIDEAPKTKPRTRRKSRTKSQSESKKVVKNRNSVTAKEKVDDSIVVQVEEPKQPTPPPPPSDEVSPEKQPDKKISAKKEKKQRKPLPNDFMLFSTPDIIRRVGGGKQDGSTPSTPNTPPVSVEMPQNINALDIPTPKPQRLGTDAKEKRPSVEKPRRTSTETKNKKISVELKQQKSVESKPPMIDRRRSSERRRTTSKVLDSNDVSSTTGEDAQSAKDIRNIIQSENIKSFTSSLVIPDSANNPSNVSKSEDDEDLNLTIDSIDEILYKVAETLADDKEFQSALDKSLDENLVLSTEALSSSFDSQVSASSGTTPISKGVQVVRADGRVVVIPPPERPTTRSRNKPKNNPHENSPTPKTPAKVVEDDVVSGAELDSSSDEDKSDDDPEKLWCICNQPHNNRFMICCDSCEEWYHGKCVNVTKQMGQMMEKEGREWICLYCKDLSLKRPAAAARRVRKASRTSGTESVGAASDSNPEIAVTSPVAVVPRKVQGCIVCGKPCRNHSIYCSDACIVQNAKDVEKVVVFERATGKLLSGNEAPTVANLDKWLKKHPGFEVVRSKANIVKQPLIAVTTKNQATLQIVKNPLHQGVSLALQKRGIQVGVLKHSPKLQSENKERPQSKGPPKTPHQMPQTPSKLLLKIVPEPKSPKKPLIQLKITQQLTPTPPNPAPSPLRKKRRSTTTVEIPATPKEKPKPKPIKPKPAPTETSLMSERKREESVRDNVKKSVGEQLMQRIQTQHEIKLNKDEVVKISNEIESQLFKCFGDTGQKYRNKYRSLMFNIKDNKNQTLWRSICQKTVSAYQLVRLSPDDLASQELALWRERENKHQLDMITKTELDQLGRPQQFVIKTHKGEQEVEDNRLSTGVDKTEMVTGLTAETPPATEVTTTDKKTKEKENKRSRSDRNKKHDKKSSSKDTDKSTAKDRKVSQRSSSRNKRSSSQSKRSASHDRNQRRKSRSRSRGNSRRTEKHRSRSRSRDRYKKSSHKSTRHKKSPPHSTTDKLDKKSKEILDNLVDNKIVPPLEDKLWNHVTQEDMTTGPLAESDSDHEPTSTVTISTPPREEDLNTSVLTPPPTNLKDDTVSVPVDDEGGSSPPPKTQDYVWSGNINMIDVAEITITAHEVSGDCTGLGDELPSCLDVVGRIPPETVWDYISKMKSSNTKAIALLRLNSTSVEAQMPYIALYSYLQSRNRLGVVKSYNKAVKDFYILPLASHMPIPQALLPLSGPSFEESRPVLLLGIIVRDNRKRSLFSPPPSTIKRFKVDKTLTPPVHTSGRSYTPPPTSKAKSIVTGASSSKDVEDEDMDEPYSPKDSDPETAPSTAEDEPKQSKPDAVVEPKFIEPFSNQFDEIPGLDGHPVVIEKQLENEMEFLDLQIAKQKEELHHMSQNIVSSSSTDVGDALSTIELPRNIQQILDSIKTPQITSSADSTTMPTAATSSDLTIPLMLPKISSRNSSSSSSSSSTIPFNISRFKNKSASINSPSTTETQLDSSTKRTIDSSGVLSALSDDELIRKANEMMKAPDEKKDAPHPQVSQFIQRIPMVPPVYPVQPPPPPPTPKSTISRILESNQPPIPGLD